MLAEEPEYTETATNLRMGTSDRCPNIEDRVKILASLGLTLDNPNLTPEQFAQLTELAVSISGRIFCSDYEQLPGVKVARIAAVLTDYTPIRQKQYPFTTARAGHGEVCRQTS
jgi:hypothetical protein